MATDKRVRDPVPWAALLRGLMWAWLPFAAALLWIASKNASNADWIGVAGTSVVFALALPAGIVLHELGHGLAGWLFRFHVPRIDVGVGRSLLSIPIGRTAVHIRALPFSGMTYMCPRSTLFARARVFLAVFAGPFANLLAAGFVINAMPNDWNGSLDHARFDPLTAWYWANIAIGFTNVIPFKTGGIQSDGLQLLTVWFRSKETIRKSVSMRYNLYAWNAHARGDFDEATKILRAGLEQFPGHLEMRHDLALMALETGDLELARAEFRDLLHEPKLDKTLRPVLKNNLAWIAVMSRGDEGLEEAHELATEALKSGLVQSTCKSTLGAVLARMNQLDRATELLTEALERSTDDSSRAHCAAWLSVAHAKRDDKDKADYYRRLARQIHPECSSLPVVARLCDDEAKRTC